MEADFSIAAASRHKVTSALKRAGDATGAGFEFLKAMAERESSLNPTAKAKTSSAAGLFQFIDQTWLGAVKQYGARHGLGDYAGDIARGSDGRFTVANPARRDEILNLRFDADKSAALAGELANENKSFLERRLGRAASGADLYTAHFLGPAGAVKLLNAASNVKAADLLPQAAAANKPVFYDGVRPKTVGEVVASIASSMKDAKEPAGAEASAPKRMAASAGVLYNQYTHKNIYNPETEPLRPMARSSVASISEAGAAFGPASAMAPMRGLESLLPASRLSALALTALQALDATQIGAGRDKAGKETP